MLHDIQSALRESIRKSAEHVGPFLVLFDDHSDNPFRNYAIPDDGARPSSADIAALVAAFEHHGRRPRLEYAAPAPAVDEALASAGFTVQLRLPLMFVEPAGLRPAPVREGITLTRAGTDDELLAVARVQRAAYREAGEADGHDVDRLRGTLRSGGSVMLARQDGVPAGAGLYTAPRGGLCEIAAVGVLPEYRGRGIASAVVTELSRAAFAAGATPYLQTESVNERRLYGRLGYRTVGELLAVGRPGAGDR